MHITVNNRRFEIPEDGRNLLAVCLELGFDIPYFCWHPAFHSVGACRQCAVKTFEDEDDQEGKLEMACMVQPRDGMRVAVDDPEAVAFRARVIEWLMLNHPHDCPVCDEGGECHLQDMTVMTGHVRRRTRFPKRTFRNQDLGPFIHHEMNRCIQCFRCVRFYRDYAHGRDFDVFGCHDHLYFGRARDGVLENEFSGNLVEVCPTGVFTDKTFRRHFTRKWDLQTAPSLCIHCGVGCNTLPGERYGMLRRIRSRYHGDVNGYFLCDRGRFGYEFVNSDRRIRQPLLRGADGHLEPVSAEDALSTAVSWLSEAPALGIGSPRASLESDFALGRLCGWERFLHGMTEGHYELLRLIQSVLHDGPCPSASLQEAARSDAALVLGEDVTNTAPMLALALRQAVLQKPMREAEERQGIPAWEDAILRESVQQERGPFFVATPDATRLDDLATQTYRAAPEDIVRLGFAIAHAIDPEAPDVDGLGEPVRRFAERVASALLEGDRPVVVSGISCGGTALIEAAANVAWALHKRKDTTKLCFSVPEANSMGLAFLGGAHVGEAHDHLSGNEPRTLVIVENDLYRHFHAESAERLLAEAEHVIVIDSVDHRTVRGADLVLPAAVFAESNGTLVNNEGRAQRYYQVYRPEASVRASWGWIEEIRARLAGGAGGNGSDAFRTGGGDPLRVSWEELVRDLAAEFDVFAPLAADPPSGKGVPGPECSVPRQPKRYSGRTAMHAAEDVHEPRTLPDRDTLLSFSMEGADLMPPPELIPRYWRPGWNSCQAVNAYQSKIAGALRGGNPGQRILRVGSAGGWQYFAEASSAFERRDGEWLVVPAYHVFGSEELSAFAPAIAELIPESYVALNAADAERLDAREGERVSVRVQDQVFEAPLVVRASLPDGVAVLPVGLPGLPGLSLPEWAVLSVPQRGGDSVPADGSEGET